MSKEQKEKIQQLIKKEQALRKRKHEDYEVQTIVADMLFIFLEIPHWKVWAWYPIARHVDLLVRVHKNCCGLELD